VSAPKHAYVRGIRTVRSVLAQLGIVELLDRWARRSRTGLWLRSLLAIYDLDDLRRLDVPWWTFRAAKEVEEFLASRVDSRIFEWGSGASTFWLASRSATVQSVEHDVDWAAAMQRDLPSNAAVRAVVPQRRSPVVVGSRKAGFSGLDFTDYVAAIDETEGPYDLIVVDGRAREACLERAVKRLAPGGLIVFDNVERRRYRRAIDRLGNAVTLRSDWGLTACLPYPSRTAVIRLVTA
jgi:hypothetical protein